MRVDMLKMEAVELVTQDCVLMVQASQPWLACLWYNNLRVMWSLVGILIWHGRPFPDVLVMCNESAERLQG